MPREDKGTCLSYFIFDQQPFEFSLKISNISKFPCLIFFFFLFCFISSRFYFILFASSVSKSFVYYVSLRFDQDRV